MEGVRAELKYWDPARIRKDGSRRVPDVVCTHPRTGVEYVLDARIYWNTMSDGMHAPTYGSGVRFGRSYLLEYYERGSYGLHRVLSHRMGC